MALFKPATPLAQAALLIGIGILFWGLCVGPAWWLAQSDGVLGLSIAAVVCIFPGCIALLVKTFLSPSQNAFFLLSSALRFGVVVGTVLVLKSQRPDLGLKQLFVWLILFYMLVLALETWLVLRRAT